MQLFEFDLRNLFAGILVFLGGCFSAGQSTGLLATNSETTMTSVSTLPNLSIYADQSDMVYFSLVTATDEKSMSVENSDETAMVRVVADLIKDLPESEKLTVSIQKAQTFDEATLKRVSSALKKNNLIRN